MKKISDKKPLNQDSLATDLFRAMKEFDVGETLRLAPLIEELDSHSYCSYEESPLVFAARHDLPLKVFDVLLPRSNPKKRNADGATALILAAWGRKHYSADIARLLLPVSDPLALMFETDSALHCAVASLNLETVALLLPHSDLDQRDRGARTALECAIESDGSSGLAVANLIREEMARRESMEFGLSTRVAEPNGPRSPRL